MPTYSIHHFSATRAEARSPAEERTADRDERPQGVRRLPSHVAARCVTKQSRSTGREALRLPAGTASPPSPARARHARRRAEAARPRHRSARPPRCRRPCPRAPRGTSGARAPGGTPRPPVSRLSQLGRDGGDRRLEHLPAANVTRPPTRTSGASACARAPRGSARCRSASVGPGSPRRPGRSAAAGGGGDGPARRRGGRAAACSRRRRDELNLLDVEAERVQPRAVARRRENRSSGGERLLARQLAPEALVAPPRSLRRLVRIEVRRQPDLGVDVEQLADDVDVAIRGRRRAARRRACGGSHLSRRRRGRRQGPGIASEERVRERAVAPEEAA